MWELFSNYNTNSSTVAARRGRKHHGYYFVDCTEDRLRADHSGLLDWTDKRPNRSRCSVM